jgi:hypothetical protein
MYKKNSLSGLFKRNPKVAFCYNFNKCSMRKWLKIMDKFQPGQFLDLGAIK